MARRYLRFKELQKLFEGHGCTFEFNRKSRYIYIARGAGPNHRSYHQHAHKGKQDQFSDITIAAIRRRLGLTDLSDDEFWAPIDG